MAYAKEDHILLDFTDEATSDYSMEIYHAKAAEAIIKSGTVVCANDTLGIGNYDSLTTISLQH